jgi:hypothetical protein
VDISQIDWSRPTAFVMGNEGSGGLHLPAPGCQKQQAAADSTFCLLLPLLLLLLLPLLPPAPASLNALAADTCPPAAGVSEAAVALADAQAVVPMVGFVDSFNISVAAALCMYEARRCRQERLG